MPNCSARTLKFHPRFTSLKSVILIESYLKAASFRSQMAEYSQYFIYNDLPAFPDSRITIKLDLALGHVKLSDRFEWDLSSYDLTPETFARQMVADLNLGGEYAPIIAHAITEQIIKVHY
jgi:hypothetical protein